MREERRWVGIDVAKATLDVHVRPNGERWSVANNEAGIWTLVEQLRGIGPSQIVLEATGGYELAAVSALAAAALPVVVVNPRQVREFAKATGRLEKTDRLDAAVRARFAEPVRPEARPLATAEQQELDALLTRRRQLIEMLTAEKNRLGQVFVRGGKQVRKSLKQNSRSEGTATHIFLRPIVAPDGYSSGCWTHLPYRVEVSHAIAHARSSSGRSAFGPCKRSVAGRRSRRLGRPSHARCASRRSHWKGETGSEAGGSGRYRS